MARGCQFRLLFWAFPQLPDKTALLRWKCDHLGFVPRKKETGELGFSWCLAPTSDGLNCAVDLASSESRSFWHIHMSVSELPAHSDA